MLPVTDVGTFYKRRDYTKIVEGRNPIIAHEFLGADVSGKDVVVIDDMISSGESMIDVATELKRRKANRIFVASTFWSVYQRPEKNLTKLIKVA